jgi:hypothetical protein
MVGVQAFADGVALLLFGRSTVNSETRRSGTVERE